MLTSEQLLRLVRMNRRSWFGDVSVIWFLGAIKGFMNIQEQENAPLTKHRDPIEVQ